MSVDKPVTYNHVKQFVIDFLKKKKQKTPARVGAIHLQLPIELCFPPTLSNLGIWCSYLVLLFQFQILAEKDNLPPAIFNLNSDPQSWPTKLT